MLGLRNNVASLKENTGEVLICPSRSDCVLRQTEGPPRLRWIKEAQSMSRHCRSWIISPPEESSQRSTSLVNQFSLVWADRPDCCPSAQIYERHWRVVTQNPPEESEETGVAGKDFHSGVPWSFWTQLHTIVLTDRLSWCSAAERTLLMSCSSTT